MKGAYSFTLCDQELQLLPEKAIFWTSKKVLLVADTHFGKIGHFRKAGLALPDKAALNNFLRFINLLEKVRPETVFFLGDLFHSDMNTEWFHFKDVLKKFPKVRFHLIQGNHDILHGSSYSNSQLELHTEALRLDPFLLTHEPAEAHGLYNLCGHIHPAVKLTGTGRQSLRLPCFYFGKKSGILPAFGEFTGLHALRPQLQDQFFVISGKEVIRVH